MSHSRFTYSSRRTLGKGAFSTVFLGTETGPDGTVKRRVAVKRIDKEVMQKNAKLRRLLRNEMQFLAQLKHPHIVALLGSFEGPHHMHLVLEYCDGGDLAGLLRRTAPISEAHTHDLLSQIVQGVQHMRSQQVAHRDLKPQNMLLMSNPNSRSGYNLKLADFGFATRLGPADLTQTFCGSPLHMAPELISGELYNPAVDLWSIGTIAYEMCAGTAPFRAKNMQELRERLRQVRAGTCAPPPVPATASTELRDLISRLLRAEPSRRLTFDGFFAHPFFHKQYAAADPTARIELVAPLSTVDPGSTDRSLERSRLDTSYILVDRAAAALGAEIDQLEQLPEALCCSSREPELRAMIDGVDGTATVLLALTENREHIEAAALLRHTMQTLRSAVSTTRARLTALGQKPSLTTFTAVHRLRGTLTACLEAAARLRQQQPSQDGSVVEPPGELSLPDVVLDAALQLMDRAVECGKVGLPVAAIALCNAAARALDALRVRSDDPLPSIQHENLATAIRQQLTRLTSARRMQSVFEHRVPDSCVLAISSTPNTNLAESRTLPRSEPIAIPRQAPSQEHSAVLARFCAHCGARFTAVEQFCPLCGTARINNVSSLQDSLINDVAT